MDARVILEPDGTPELYIDGQRQTRVWSRLNEPGYFAPEKLDQYAGTGIDIFFTCNNNKAASGWDGRDHVDFGHYDAHLRAIIAKKPDIKLILYWGFADGAPYLWRKDHQDELVLTDRGIRIGIASFASRRWIDDSCAALRRFVEHYSQGEWAKHVIGYNPIYLNNEWFCWTDHGAGAADFSEVNVAGFRQWLAAKYGGDVQRLRAAWKRAVSFETAMPPTAAEREGLGEEGTFDYIEHHGGNVADYFRFHNESVAGLFLAWCRTIKQVSGGSKLAGGMFLYTRMGWPSLSNRFGHDAVRMVLDSPDVDYFHGPYGYTNRSFGGVHLAQQAANSVIAAGKLHVDQIDSKTYIHPPPNTNARTPWETLQLLKRDVGYSLGHNGHHYWYEMAMTTFGGQNQPGAFRRNTYDAPDINRWIARLKEIADENQRLRPGAKKEVLLLSSKDADYYRNPDMILATHTMLSLRAHFMPYTAVPYDDAWLEEFERLGGGYKCYLFLNAFHVPQRLRDAIRNRLRGSGATAVWVYAPGYVRDDVPVLEHCEDLAGIRLAKLDVKDYLQVKVTDVDHPITAGVRRGFEYGTDLDPAPLQARQEWASWIVKERQQQKVRPIYYADDPGARVLGEVRGHGVPGLVVKEVDGFRSVFSAAPLLDTALLVSLFDACGVHRYSSAQDLVYANDGLVTVCANGAGEREIRLPQARDVVDAFTGERLADRTDRLRVTLQHGEALMLKTRTG
jgi:beta-galactosidase